MENRRVILVLMPIEIIDCAFTLLTTVAQILHAMVRILIFGGYGMLRYVSDTVAQILYAMERNSNDK